MPCVFFTNVPEEKIRQMKEEDVLYLLDQLVEIIAELSECPIEEVQLHFSLEKFAHVHTSEGDVTDSHGVHATVWWFAGRTPRVKQLIGEAIDCLLYYIDLGSCDLTFFDLPPNSFYFGGQLVGN